MTDQAHAVHDASSTSSTASTGSSSAASAPPAARCRASRSRRRWPPRPGADHRDVQPEGRRRQDDDHDQPGRGARRVRPQGAAPRLRPAGRAVGRARHQPARARQDGLQPADRAARRRRTTSSARPASRSSTCCRRTSTCPRPRCSSSARSRASRSSRACCAPVLDDYDVILIDCQPSLGPAHGQRADRGARRDHPAGVRVLRAARRRAAGRDHREGPRPAEPGAGDRRHPRHDVRPAHAAQPRGRRAGRRGVRRPGLPHRHRAHGEVPGRLRRRRADHHLRQRRTPARTPTASWPASSSPAGDAAAAGHPGQRRRCRRPARDVGARADLAVELTVETARSAIVPGGPARPGTASRCTSTTSRARSTCSSA